MRKEHTAERRVRSKREVKVQANRTRHGRGELKLSARFGFGSANILPVFALVRI